MSINCALRAIAAKLFLAIADEWSLSQQQRAVISGVGRTTLHNWKHRVEAGEPLTLPVDTLERLSYVAGIYKALHILYGDKLADEWIHLPNTNPIFNGRTPLADMLGGGLLAMQTVRRLLDARRGGL